MQYASLKRLKENSKSHLLLMSNAIHQSMGKGQTFQQSTRTYRELIIGHVLFDRRRFNWCFTIIKRDAIELYIAAIAMIKGTFN